MRRGSAGRVRRDGNRFVPGPALRIREAAHAAAFSSPDLGDRYSAGMNTTNKPEPARPDPTKLQPTLGHLLLRDTRTPEEQHAASLKESARRKGRGRGKWWEKAT